MDWLDSIGTSVAKRSMKAIFEVKDKQDLIAEEIRLSNTMLAILQNAPYLQAMLHLKDGEIDKCKDKIIETMAKDPLNLRARILYVRLLGYFGKHERAIEECFNLLEWFGLSNQLATFLPAVLMDSYYQYLCNLQVSFTPFYYEQEDYYIQEFICFSDTILTRWRRKYFGWFERFYTAKYKVIAFSTHGIEIFAVANREIKYLTNKLAVLANSSGLNEVYDINNGQPFALQLSSKQCEALFSPSPRFNKFIDTYHFIDDRILRAKWPPSYSVKTFKVRNFDIHTISWDRSVVPDVEYYGAQVNYGGGLELTSVDDSRGDM